MADTQEATINGGSPDDDENAPVDADAESSSSSDEEDDDLVLEGVIVRNPDASDSDDSSESDEEAAASSKPPPAKKIKSGAAKKSTKSEPDIVQVEFTFCDMSEKFFHGLKIMLTSSSPIFAPQSSALADLMIENVSVGTVVSSEGDEDGTIFGYASVLNVETYQDRQCIQDLKKVCMAKCPDDHKKELEVVLSGKTKRPAGFYFQGRMVNLPLEIVQILHEQLALDMEWAVKNAEGGEETRKSLDFGAFVLIAPTYRSNGALFFKNFDDKIFASHAEFSYDIELPKTFGMEEAAHCTVIVLTRTGHGEALNSLKQMVTGGVNTG